MNHKVMIFFPSLQITVTLYYKHFPFLLPSLPIPPSSFLSPPPAPLIFWSHPIPGAPRGVWRSPKVSFTPRMRCSRSSRRRRTPSKRPTTRRAASPTRRTRRRRSTLGARLHATHRAPLSPLTALPSAARRGRRPPRASGPTGECTPSSSRPPSTSPSSTGLARQLASSERCCCNSLLICLSLEPQAQGAAAAAAAGVAHLSAGRARTRLAPRPGLRARPRPPPVRRPRVWAEAPAALHCCATPAHPPPPP